ncbi:MAG TPA: peptidylprolyl isomerase [bacterium]|nr:peptidylprolyl isomerase [bacterium]HPS28844.1 peptidylprolyl isomerase [bacterium]
MKKSLIILIFLLISFNFISAEEKLLNRIALKVNGKIITLFDLKKNLNPENPGAVSSEVIMERKADLIEKAVSDELVKQELQVLKMEIGDEEIDRAAENVALQNQISLEQLKAEIEKQGLEWNVYKNTVLRSQLELLNLKRHITVTTVDVDETILKSIYDNQFKKEDNYTASHIILKSAAENAEDGAVYKKISSIYNQIVEGKVSFEDAAKSYSEDGSADKGGMLGTFPLNQMVPEFSTKLKEMKEGEISKPFKSRYGWHIVKLMKVELKDPPPYSELRGRLLNVYYQQNMEKAFQSWLNKKREESKIEILF